MRTITTTILLLSILHGFAQKQHTSERTAFIELNERAEFYHVNNRYKIASDTIFYSNTGFLIHPDYATKEIGGVDYVIVTYPNYAKGSTYQVESIQTLSEITIAEVNESGIHVSIVGKNDRLLMIEKTVFENLSQQSVYDVRFTKGYKPNWPKYLKWTGYIVPEWKNYRLTTGLLTVPFKFRPELDTTNFNLTTDVTIGPYIGLTKRLSKRSSVYATIPATLGLSFVNIQNNTTSNEIQTDEIGVVPGISWSSGVIFQINKFDIGFVFGKDYASGIGDDWIYQGETWYSFAIGYSFLKQEEE